MEDLEANKTQPPPATVWLWLGYGALCVGMFMAILDIQVVVTSLAVIEDALKIGADRMSWVQTTYLIAEIISIPLTGLAHPHFHHPLALRRGHFHVYACLHRLRLQL